MVKKTTPYNFYQYWINVGDEDAKKYIKVFTLLGKEEIESLIAAHDEAPHQRLLQKALAEDVTRRVHGQEALDDVLALTNFFFARKINRQMLDGLSPKSWSQVSENSDDTLVFSKEKLSEGINVMDFLADLGITSSKGEARRSITKDKSVAINGEKCEDIEMMLTASHTFHDRYMLIQKGKKNKYIVALE